MLVSMVHLLFRSENGALADTLPNHRRWLFSSTKWHHVYSS